MPAENSCLCVRCEVAQAPPHTYVVPAVGLELDRVLALRIELRRRLYLPLQQEPIRRFDLRELPFCKFVVVDGIHRVRVEAAGERTVGPAQPHARRSEMVAP